MKKHQPIQMELHEAMNELAKWLDNVFNGDVPKAEKKTCFVLLTASFDVTNGGVNYISNGNREDVINLLKELIVRFENQVEGHA